MPEMTWIDWIVVSAVVIVGLFILYRPLKDPIDMFFGLVGRGLGAFRDKISDWNDSSRSQYEEIRYG
jgi:hypothetical protein